MLNTGPLTCCVVSVGGNGCADTWPKTAVWTKQGMLKSLLVSRVWDKQPHAGPRELQTTCWNLFRQAKKRVTSGLANLAAQWKNSKQWRRTSAALWRQSIVTKNKAWHLHEDEEGSRLQPAESGGQLGSDFVCYFTESLCCKGTKVHFLFFVFGD